MNLDKNYCFLFSNGKLLVKENKSKATIPFIEELKNSNIEYNKFYSMGLLYTHECYAANLGNETIPGGYSLLNLRQLYGHIPDKFIGAAYRSFHILNWVKNNKYCGCCGSPMNLLTHEVALKCSYCGQVVYPRISPAIIVAVTKGNQLLLARSNRFPPNRYSVIAGFVEAGEALEDCVKRELKEEVGIEVNNIKYFGSQPWPFPDSLMIAFTAEYSGGELTIDNNEIVEAGWFTAHTFPDLPGKDSIARQLIDCFAAKYQK